MYKCCDLTSVDVLIQKCIFNLENAAARDAVKVGFGRCGRIDVIPKNISLYFTHFLALNAHRTFEDLGTPMPMKYVK